MENSEKFNKLLDLLGEAEAFFDAITIDNLYLSNPEVDIFCRDLNKSINNLQIGKFDELNNLLEIFSNDIWNEFTNSEAQRYISEIYCLINEIQKEENENKYLPHIDINRSDNSEKFNTLLNLLDEAEHLLTKNTNGNMGTVETAEFLLALNNKINKLKGGKLDELNSVLKIFSPYNDWNKVTWNDGKKLGEIIFHLIRELQDEMEIYFIPILPIHRLAA